MIYQDFLEHVVNPSLKKIGLYSEAAADLVVATVAAESNGGERVTQVNGPALGIIQMEAATYYSLWNNFLAYKPTLKRIILESCYLTNNPPAEELITNLKLCVIMARIQYLQFPDPLPHAFDIEGIWAVYKKCYNTNKGAATYEGFVNRYKKFKGLK